MAQVLVAGAGPTGLAVACGLLCAGVEARIVDRADGPAITSRALGLQPRGAEVLDRLGALADLPERSVHLAGTVIRVGGKEKIRLAVPSGVVLGGRSALSISQAEIEARLRARVAELGGTVEWGRELTGAEQDPDGVTVSFADGSTARCGWVVGCDGAGSRVRKAIGVHFTGTTAAERYLLADVQVELPVTRGFASMWITHRGALAAVPLPGENRWRLMAPVPTTEPHEFNEPDEIPARRVLDMLTEALQQRAGLRASGIGEVSWTSAFRVHRRLASSYRCGRVLLAGDAAHVHSPTGGQGMNTGVGDAENLAFKLRLVVQDHADPTLLDTYEDERRPIAASVVYSVRGIDKLLLSKNPVVRLARKHILYPAANRPVVQRRIWHKASQLGISYRKGPLAGGSKRRIQGRRPGDRIPNLPCRRTDGRETWLHAELGARWALLTSDRMPRPAFVTSVLDRLGSDQLAILAVSGWPADRTALVRPDAHIAWQGPVDDDAVLRWLSSALHRTRLP